MKRSMFVLFALCGLLWPSVGYSQDPVRTPATDPNLRLRHVPNFEGTDTLFVDWSTVYAKPQDATSTLQTGTPASSYSFYLNDLSTGTSLPPISYNAQDRRDTLLVAGVNEGTTYEGILTATFPDGSIQPNDNNQQSLIIPFAHVGLSVDPTFVREDAGATTIEVKAQFQQEAYRSGQEFQVTPVAERVLSYNTGLNDKFYLDTSVLVIDPESDDWLSATGQITLTPIDDSGYNRVMGPDFVIRIGAQEATGSYAFQHAQIRLLDDDRPTSEIELTVSDPAISTDGRATDVTVTGTLNGALLDEPVSFQLGVMPPTTATRDTDFGIRLARLTIPAGQATGTATVRVTPHDRNGGQIWLGVAEHPTIGTGSNQRTIVVKEAAIELTKQPSRAIADIKVIPDHLIREDAGQVNVDLKVSLKDALPVDEIVRFEIVEECDNNSITRCLPDVDVARRETDYYAELPPLTIPAGQKEATGTLSFEIVDNSNTDKPRVIWVVATLGNSRYTQWIFIEDDETATSVIRLSASSTEIAEDSGQTTITVTGTLLGSALSESLTIVLTHSDGFSGWWGGYEGVDVAARDADYTAVFEPLTIPAGQTSATATLTITPTPNDGQEEDEQILINSVDRRVKITENGQEREIVLTGIIITLKDVADASASATQTEDSSLAFDAPASTVISGMVGETLSVELPTAKGDPESQLTYRVFNLPAGLTFDAVTRTISGIPTSVGQTAIEYYALSKGVSPVVLTYTIDIQEKVVDPVKLDDLAASLLSIREDTSEAAAVTLTITLRKAAKGDVVVGLAIVSPIVGKTAKLNEDFTATLPATVTIPTGKMKGTAQMSVQPKDNTTADGNKAFAVEATSPSGHRALANIQIIDDETASPTASAGDDSATPDSDEDGGQAEDGSQAEDDGEDSQDTFAFISTVDDQAYTEGTEITALMLPEATGDQGEITYRVFDLPAGLAFDPATRTVSGTPTAATDGAVAVTYLAQDSAGRGITLTFSITVNPALSFGDLFGADGG